jgi:flagellar L-ring protein precursor FlgH
VFNLSTALRTVSQPRIALPKGRAHLLLALGGLSLLTACASAPDSMVQGPTTVRPPNPPTTIERVNNGAIYQASGSGWLFQDEKRPSAIGDTLKVDISERLSASTKVNSKANRENTIAAKGPGTGSSQSGLIKSLLNVDASASGSDTFKGEGQTDNSSTFNGRIAAQVINVLPNGHLLVAGEKRMAFNGGTTTLRFSGIVDPKDIKPGAVVASGDVVDARLEQLGQGDVASTSSRTWIQRLLTNSLAIW